MTNVSYLSLRPMSFPSTPNRLEAVFIQRDASNTRYDQINISGSDLIVYLDATGSINADKISVWAAKYNIGSGSVSSGSTASASWASHSLSSSYAATASLLLGSIESASYALTASYAITSSRALTASLATAINFVPQTAVSASWASSSISASYALSASFAPSTPSNTAISASWASQSLSASYAPVEPAYSASVASKKQDILVTGNTYPITSSWSNNALTASSINFTPTVAVSASWASSSISASYAFSSSHSETSSFAISASWAPSTPSDTATSASWASSSLSASYATTASFLLGSVESASYALLSTNYTGRFYVTRSISVTASNFVDIGTFTTCSNASPFSGHALFVGVVVSNTVQNSALSKTYAISCPYANIGGIFNDWAIVEPISVGPSTDLDDFDLIAFGNVNDLVLRLVKTVEGLIYPMTASITMISVGDINTTFIPSTNTGSISVTKIWQGSMLTSSFATTASYSNTASFTYFADSASYALTSSFAESASWAPSTPSDTATSASWASASLSSSYALSASHANVADILLVPVRSGVLHTGSNTQNVDDQWGIATPTGSGIQLGAGFIIYFDGTGNFNNDVLVSGSLTALSGVTGSLLGTASWSEKSISASYALTSSFAISASWAPSAPSDSASYALSSSYAGTASLLLGSVTSASYALTSSFSLLSPTGRSVVLCSALTPLVSGADFGEVSIPYSPLDGITPVTYSVRRLVLRVQTTATDSSSIDIEKSSATGVFSASTIGSITLPSGSYEEFNTGSLGTVVSNDKLRFNITALGTAQNWTIITEISNP